MNFFKKFDPPVHIVVYSSMEIKEKHPLVSVIIPAHNRAWCLERALDSALNQTYSRLEVIVVNDGSTDDTPDILARYRGRIQVWTLDHQGVSAARNLGIRNSKGDFVALLDSDDAWEPGKIACQVEFFMGHPDALICQTEEIWIRNGRRVNPKKKHQKPSGLIFEPSLHLCLVSPSAVMIKKQLFDMIGCFDEDFPVCEDYDLWLRISAAGIPVYLIDMPGTVKTGGHEDQLSARHSQDKFRIRSILKLLDAGRLTPDQAHAAVRVLTEKCRIYGKGCLKRGNRDEGNHYLRLADSLNRDEMLLTEDITV